MFLLRKIYDTCRYILCSFVVLIKPMVTNFNFFYKVHSGITMQVYNVSSAYNEFELHLSLHAWV